MGGRYCTSYCSHGGRCEQLPGHAGMHDSGYCQWVDADGLTKAAADRVLADKPGGQEFLSTIDPLANLIEGMSDEET